MPPWLGSLAYARHRLLLPLNYLILIDVVQPFTHAQQTNFCVLQRDNLEGYLERRGGTVKVAFFGGSDTLHRVQDPPRAAGSQVRVASLVDLAGMKMRVVQVRGSWKDYVDIHALASHGVDIPTGLASARAIDPQFNPAISIRALQFYGDGSLSRVPIEVQRDLTRWAQAVDVAKLPKVPSRRGLAPE